ncbi:MAG: bis(5'-nucleosyl)-tetraphosphatase (symmetrical) YqeK [Tissierellia bacterium]|nr:bis(5'-nucleosyl)-tetraphosphatase (symmetrical) YqeK [Tissierellia bacterium]
MNRKDLDRILKEAKDRIGPKRFAHNQRVAKTARDLALTHGLDPDRAYLAAILHDIAKTKDLDQLKALAQAYQVDWTPEFDRMPQIAHGFIGAQMARMDLGLEDEEILGAIAYHTTGREAMSQLEKLVYLADYIEPGRDFPGVDKARDLAKKDLDQAMVYALTRTLGFLLQEKIEIALDTVRAWNSYQRG